MKYAEDLYKDYDFNNKNEFFNYIIESLINGNRSQVRELFNEMKPESQEEFLINYLDITKGYDKSVLNICISELCK